MKKHLLTTFALLASCFCMSAQQTWFPNKVGAKLTYGNYDPKGKLTSTDIYEVTDVSKDGGKTTISFNITASDAKGNASGVVIPGKVWSADDYFHTDAKSSLSGLVNLDAVTIKGHAPIFPENPKNGDKLDDCHVTIEELMTEMNWTNIKVTTGQSVTTPAGTFNDAVLFECNLDSKIAIIKVQGTTKEWYVKGIGRVRSESYNNKGKLTSYIELISSE